MLHNKGFSKWGDHFGYDAHQIAFIIFQKI